MSTLALEGACLQFPAAARAVSEHLLQRLRVELGYVQEGQTLRCGRHSIRVVRDPSGAVELIAGDAESALLLAHLRAARGYRAAQAAPGTTRRVRETAPGD